MTTSTAITGSSSFGFARCIASLKAIEPAILNAISLESTSWYEPSTSVDADVDDRVAGEDARLHRLLDAEVDRRDVLARDLAADDLVDELVALARLGRLEVDDRVAVLAAAAGLADEPALDLLDGLADRLAVGDLRAADVRVDVELAHQAVDDDLEVQLAHPGDERLPGLLVGAHAEGRILLGQALERRRRACPGRPSSSARSRPRSPGPGRSSTRARIGAVSTASVSPVVVCFRPTTAAISPAPISSRSSRWFACIWRMRPMRSVLPVVVFSDPVARLHLARVDADVRQLADVRVGHDLEGERRERLVERGAARELVLGARVDAVDRAARRAGSAGSR